MLWPHAHAFKATKLRLAQKIIGIYVYVNNNKNKNAVENTVSKFNILPLYGYVGYAKFYFVLRTPFPSTECPSKAVKPPQTQKLFDASTHFPLTSCQWSHTFFFPIRSLSYRA